VTGQPSFIVLGTLPPASYLAYTLPDDQESRRPSTSATEQQPMHGTMPGWPTWDVTPPV
jgi:hypothetical protein